MDFEEFIKVFEPLVFPVNGVEKNEKGELISCTCKDLTCKKIGKHPLLKENWKNIATRDYEKILQWKKKYPSCNFAILTGRKLIKDQGYYLIVLDVDHSLINDFINQFSIPETFFYKTGSGYHFWFKSKKNYKCSVKMEGFNLDIRGNNGYVIVPPGENKNGKYEFINSGTKTLAELPEKIIKLINSKKSKRIEIKEKIPAVKHFEKPRKKNIEKEAWANKEIDNIIKNINSGLLIPVGIRNVVVHKFLSSLRANGAEKQQLKNEMIKISSFLEEDLPAREKEDILNSVLSYKKNIKTIEDANRCYAFWLQKNMAEFSLISLDEICQLLMITEKCFINSLTKTTNYKTSLQKVLEKRNLFFSKIKNNFLPAKITQGIYGTFLVENGFSKRHTSTANFWNIEE